MKNVNQVHIAVRQKPTVVGILTMVAVLSITAELVFPGNAFANGSLAPTCTLSAVPTSITSGSSATLSWTTSNATSISINQGIGSVSPVSSGSTSVSPTTTTTYMATVSNTSGTATCTTTVTVTPVCKKEKPTGSVTDGNATLTVPAGDCPVTVSFSSYNLPDGKIKPFSHQVLYDNITQTYSPGTYHIGLLKLACNWQTDLYIGLVQTILNNTYGTANLIAYDLLAGQTCTLPPSAPTCTLSAVPTSITSGSSATLSWTTSNATSISINQGIGSVSPVSSGSTSVSPTTTTIYTGTATGQSGTIHCTTTITVTTSPPSAPTCTLSASPTTVNSGDHTTLSWTTKNADTFSIDQGIGDVTPADKGSVTSKAITGNTLFTGTVTSSSGQIEHCTASVTLAGGGGGGGGPTCSLTASPTSITPGGSSTLSWSGADILSVDINNGVATGTTSPGSISVLPTGSSSVTYKGTFHANNGQTLFCTATVTLAGGGCTSNCGRGSNTPSIVLMSLPHVISQPLSFLYLSQIPYTGLDLGPWGMAFYWIGLVTWSLALAYLVLFVGMPFIRRRIQSFNQRVAATLNSHTVSSGGSAVLSVPAAPTFFVTRTTTTNVTNAATVEGDGGEEPRGYSAYEGFKSFSQDGILSIEDIVQGLSRANDTKHALIKGTSTESSAHINVEPIENAPPSVLKEAINPAINTQDTYPINNTTIMTTTTVETIAPSDILGFVSALIEGDRSAVFAGLRQQVRGGGSPEEMVSKIACLLDDAYRARIDGTPCDAETARIVARLDTPTLEKLVASLTTAIDSSYSTGVIGAKLALTRALATIGA